MALLFCPVPLFLSTFSWDRMVWSTLDLESCHPKGKEQLSHTTKTQAKKVSPQLSTMATFTL
jgi:hypothetical protein